MRYVPDAVCAAARSRESLPPQDIPVGDLEPDLAAALLASLDVAPADGAACAAAARLWEEALEAHRAAPYLQLRVADMRMALSSRVTALGLYEEVGSSVLCASSALLAEARAGGSCSVRCKTTPLASGSLGRGERCTTTFTSNVSIFVRQPRLANGDALTSCRPKLQTRSLPGVQSQSALAVYRIDGQLCAVLQSHERPDGGYTEHLARNQHLPRRYGLG